ncbi:PREDICTED: uncharacterized protein LOC109343269 [Lupinus angustifolius]|uniref:uncharacterized protein LOC109343269 n=1 Tax=Lupinus angustifolius TaxID=3871 RepID=UPI00092E21FD|nr:PREDICTED: uncharacterized protein LOC109343269 [Lupinus angustifolius]
MLSTIPSKDEIKAVVFAMNEEGVPGPDEFGGCFFQEFWDIIGHDGWILPNLNSNNIVLIPKFSGVDKIEDFRPIALVDFQFKIITKVLAYRLAIIAPKIISNQQRGFIKDRHIQDCICIASEAINLLDHKIFDGNLTIKLDVKKALDTIDWMFLMDTLKTFGFANSFINWVEVIPNSAKLSISVNAQSVGVFSCKRGGTKRELLAIKGLFIDYAKISGQCLNLDKCKFYSTQANARKIVNLTNWLGFGTNHLPFNYLGVLLFKGKPKAIHLQSIADKIVNNCPVNLLKMMDNCIRNFICSRNTHVKKLVAVAWHKEWATFYKKRFCKSSKSRSTYMKSSVWPGVKRYWHLIMENSIWLLGNGNNINYWLDNWLGYPLTDLLGIPNPISSVLLAKVANFIHDSSWIIPSWMARLHPEVCQQIVKTPISNASMDDMLAWLHSSDGILTMKEAYLFTKPAQSQHNSCKHIWNKARFENMAISTAQATVNIKMDTSFKRNFSKIRARPSMTEFSILRAFNVKCNYNKTPRIYEVIWNLPSPGWVKINSDGAAKGFLGHAGKVAYLKGWHLIWLECDSTWVAEIFMGSRMVPWKLSNLMHKCRNTMLGMQVRVSHIFREGNACADKLANFGVNSRTDSWWNCPLSFI